jgi:hypothetical protein
MEATVAKIKYDNWKAITYAKNYCGKEDNSCKVFLKGENKSDCAHFIAHCLAAGGIVIKNDDQGTAFCPHGLAVRNTVLVTELRKLDTQFENVTEIGLTDGIVGDVGFLDILKPYHAFMVCEPFDLSKPLEPPKVYAHSSSRCCERMDTSWKQWFSTMFRITDA